MAERSNQVMPDEVKKTSLELKKINKVFAKVESDEVTHALQDVSVSMASGELAAGNPPSSVSLPA